MGTWTGPDIVTAVIAGLALGVGGASLAWQIIAWRRSGAKLKVIGNVGMTFGPLGSDTFVTVTAANHGRAATAVQTMGFIHPEAGTLLSPQGSYLIPTKLPKTLQPGEEVDYGFDPAALVAECREKNVDLARLVPFARTGHGVTKGKMKQGALDHLARVDRQSHSTGG